MILCLVFGLERERETDKERKKDRGWVGRKEKRGTERKRRANYNSRDSCFPKFGKVSQCGKTLKPSFLLGIFHKRCVTPLERIPITKRKFSLFFFLYIRTLVSLQFDEFFFSVFFIPPLLEFSYPPK